MVKIKPNDYVYLPKCFLLNKNDAIWQIIENQTVSFKNVMPAFYNLIQTFPCSTVYSERGYSPMNIIYALSYVLD